MRKTITIILVILFLLSGPVVWYLDRGEGGGADKAPKPTTESVALTEKMPEWPSDAEDFGEYWTYSQDLVSVVWEYTPMLVVIPFTILLLWHLRWVLLGIVRVVFGVKNTPQQSPTPAPASIYSTPPNGKASATAMHELLRYREKQAAKKQQLVVLLLVPVLVGLFAFIAAPAGMWEFVQMVARPVGMLFIGVSLIAMARSDAVDKATSVLWSIIRFVLYAGGGLIVIGALGYIAYLVFFS